MEHKQYNTFEEAVAALDRGELTVESVTYAEEEELNEQELSEVAGGIVAIGPAVGPLAMTEILRLARAVKLLWIAWSIFSNTAKVKVKTKTGEIKTCVIKLK